MSRTNTINSGLQASAYFIREVLLVAVALLSVIEGSAQSAPLSHGLGASHLVNGHPTARDKVSEIIPLRCTPQRVPDFIWGITLTQISNTSEITSALADLRSSFPKLKPNDLPPIMVRVVFDPSKSEEDFIDSVRNHQIAISNISKYTYVMGTIADSYDWYPYTSPESDKSTSGHNNYRSRTEQLVRAMGDCVQVWEIGNEVNGEWTGWKEGHVPDDQGRLSNMRDKIKNQITDAFKVVQEYNSKLPPISRKKTAITLLYNSDGPEGNRRTCYQKGEYEMRLWAKNYIDTPVRENIDYVLISYYENQKDCPGLMQDAGTFISNFKALASKEMFPTAKMGFGEIGYKETCPKDDNKRADNKDCIFGKPRCSTDRICIGQQAYIRKYYQTLNIEIRSGFASARLQKPKVALPDFIGGYFYWFFVQDMTGKNKLGETQNQERNRNALKDAMSNPAFQ
jgi:hypothetical protein